MPTPVNSARQCLAAEAAVALDDAVSAARRRGHAQTTSLHVVYALLSSSSSSSASASASASSSASASPSSSSSSSSILRDALSRARSSAYSPRLQFKALELSFGVALDRLPSSTHHLNNQQAASSEAGAPAGCDEPPVSNSLMAAIKRSQANQRRNPDTFHLYQQQQSCVVSSGLPSSTATTMFSSVKVELQQLVLAILDDPVVSRVFGDAGFRSTDIKLAVLRPPPPILRFPRATRCPPLFLCNFSAGDGFDPALTHRGLVFPFASGASQLCSGAGEENCRRIGEILSRKAGGRNPMLVGVGADEAARDFVQALERQNWAALPLELRGIKLISIKKEMVELRTSASEGNSTFAGRLEEIGRSLELPGTILSIGDLKEMVEREDEEDELERFFISEITRLLELQHGRLWVMGWSATYETYMKFLSRYPLLDKDWDLQLLPITSVRAAPVVAGSLRGTSSLMESFVPFGGFFPATYESKSLLSTSYPSFSRCQNCNEKYEQEVAVLKEHSGSAEDQHNPILPFWINKANVVNLNQQIDSAKTQDEKPLLNSKIKDLQKKWDDYCQRLHQGCNRAMAENSQSISSVIDPEDGCDKTRVNEKTGSPDGTHQSKRGDGIPFPVSLGLKTITSATQGLSGPSFLEPRNKDLISMLQVEVPRSKQLQREGFGSQQVALSDLGHYNDHASPASVTSVTTDLVLGTPGKEENTASQAKKDMLEHMHGCFPSENVDTSRSVQQVSAESPWSCSPSTHVKFSNPPIVCNPVPKVFNGRSPFEQSSLVSSNMSQKFDISSYKSFYSSLIEKVGRQEEVLSTISEAVIRCRSSERRRGGRLKGDIWFVFQGSDKIGKRRAALALAELIYGSKENFVCVDLSSQEGTTRPGTICDEEVIKGDDSRFRGKTNVDCIAAELRNKPCSVFFLENVDKADFLVQSVLSQAIRTGKFRDSYGREFSINNAIFVLNKDSIESKTYSHRKDDARFCEESVLGARFWQMKMFVEPCPESLNDGRKANVSVSPRHKSSRMPQPSCSVSVSKRKLDSYEYCRSECEPSAPIKRTHASTKSVLDLNLPVQEAEAPINADAASPQTDSQLDNSETWMEDFLDMLDASVKFKPFDFDALSDGIVMDLSKLLYSAAGSDCMLEIDPKVMEQILAAAWSSGNREALNNWFHQVLIKSFVELNRRRNLSAHHDVIRLVAVEDEYTEKYADSILLPRRIMID